MENPSTVHNYPPGIACVLRIVSHCDSQYVLSHLLPVQGAVYIDDASLGRKKEGERSNRDRAQYGYPMPN